MEPQPTTSAVEGTSTAARDGGQPTPSDDGVEAAAVAFTSGSSTGQEQQDAQLFSIIPLIPPGSLKKQLQQLFAATCRVKLLRCDVQVPDLNNVSSDSRPDTVAKVEEEKTGSGSSSEDGEVQVLPAPVKERVTKKTLAKHRKTRTQRNGVCPGNKSFGGWRPKGPWTCKLCGKRMKSSSNYLPHMRSHRGEKGFKCGECGKGFGRIRHLAEHKRIHSGVWQYVCTFCEKGFHQEQNLFSHLRVHTEEMPYFCVVDGCGMSFRHSGSLKMHRRLIHLKKY